MLLVLKNEKRRKKEAAISGALALSAVINASCTTKTNDHYRENTRLFLISKFSCSSFLSHTSSRIPVQTHLHNESSAMCNWSQSNSPRLSLSPKGLLPMNQNRLCRFKYVNLPHLWQVPSQGKKWILSEACKYLQRSQICDHYELV